MYRKEHEPRLKRDETRTLLVTLIKQYESCLAVTEYKRNRIIMSRAQKEGQEDLLYSKCTKDRESSQ
jgi:hypothetical protein